MRAFKKIWAEFSNQKTGYLERNRFPAFFSVKTHMSALLTRADFPFICRNSAVFSKSGSIPLSTT